MGIDLDRFIEEVDNEYICGICTMVLKEPQLTKCEHTFCAECINQWLDQERSCPSCRSPIAKRSLKPPQRNFRNLLGKLKLRCEYAQDGCGEILKLDDMMTHINVCPHNPNLEVKCPKGCGSVLRVCQIHAHIPNCVANLRKLIEDQAKEIKSLKEEHKGMMETSLTYQTALKNEQAKQIGEIKEALNHLKKRILDFGVMSEQGNKDLYKKFENLVEKRVRVSSEVPVLNISTTLASTNQSKGSLPMPKLCTLVPTSDPGSSSLAHNRPLSQPSASSFVLEMPSTIVPSPQGNLSKVIVLPGQNKNPFSASTASQVFSSTATMAPISPKPTASTSNKVSSPAKLLPAKPLQGQEGDAATNDSSEDKDIGQTSIFSPTDSFSEILRSNLVAELNELKQKPESEILKELNQFISDYNVRQQLIAESTQVSQGYLSRFLRGEAKEMSERSKNLVYAWYLIAKRDPGKMYELKSGQIVKCLPPESKRDRFVFQKQHIDLLEKHFIEDPYPDTHLKEEIAQECNDAVKKFLKRDLQDKELVTVTIVSNWFNNRRKEKKKSNTPLPKPHHDSLDLPDSTSDPCVLRLASSESAPSHQKSQEPNERRYTITYERAQRDVEMVASRGSEPSTQLPQEEAKTPMTPNMDG